MDILFTHIPENIEDENIEPNVFDNDITVECFIIFTKTLGNLKNHSYALTLLDSIPNDVLFNHKDELIGFSHIEELIEFVDTHCYEQE